MPDQALAKPDDTGGLGGLLLDRVGRKDVLRTLQQALQRGLHVGDIGLGKAIAVAEVMLDDEKCTARDRLRAAEFIKAVTDKGIEVALAASKEETPVAGLGVQQNNGPTQINYYLAQPPAKPLTPAPVEG